MASIAASFDSTGISAPDFPTVLQTLTDAYTGIYGTDAYLAPDSQDGQWLGVIAQAIHDCNSVAIAVYNAFSPATAQGENLSSVVKINGIARLVPSNSTMPLTVGGSSGTVLPQTSYVTDVNQVSWYFNNAVTIPNSGLAYVTATCSQAGAIQAAANTVTIGSPTFGWQTVTNGAATPGAQVENDASLRARQAQSTALPSNTVLEGIIGAVLDIQGVARVKAYENATDTADANGIPAHTLALVVDGGDTVAVASAIASRKTPGGQLAGNVSAQVIDTYGNATTIRFYRPTMIEITATVTIQPLPGYNASTGPVIQQAAIDYINGGTAGALVDYLRLVAAVAAVGQTFKIVSVVIGRSGGSTAAADVPLAFTEEAFATTADITIALA